MARSMIDISRNGVLLGISISFMSIIMNFDMGVNYLTAWDLDFGYKVMALFVK